MKIIMIDGFKPSYLKHAPYLKSLTEKYTWGELEMPLGHWAGMEIFFRGKSNRIALFYKTKNSSLKWTKHFSWLDNLGGIGRFLLDSSINLIRFLRREELFKTGQISLRKLHRFDFCVRRPLHAGLPISFKYLGEVDKIGHEYGTESKEIIKAIKKVDKKISKMKFDIILSDHGMVNITKTISVPRSKNCFIDSDMARYWGEKEELEEIEKDLPLKDGKIIKGVDKRFGELVFLANTGILLSPNDWQGKKHVKAMHGYDGKHKEMKAFYLLRENGKKKNIGVDELHKKFKQMLEDGK